MKTSQLVYSPNQQTGLFMMSTLGFNEVLNYWELRSPITHSDNNIILLRDDLLKLN